EGSKRWGKRKGGGNGYGNGNGGGGVVVGKKRVMVVIDHSTGAKHAMMWALTHVTNKGDLLTLLHVEVEALVIQGPKLATVLSQVRKLEASVLVLSQTKPSPFPWSSREEFVEECINKADCLTLAVRKQSKGVGGYLVSTRWQKNFWLLA
ncbi:hypothetical protein ACMD2_10506, partial [Ananas comosus]